MGPERATPTASPTTHPRGMVVDCSARSEANFPRAFADPRNLVVGPLVLVGGAEATPASAIREFGGQKIAVLVKTGHTVTVQLPRGARSDAGLFYGQGGVLRETRLRDAERTITFVSCRPDEPSASGADGAVTFWSGFVFTRAPSCVPLEVYVDELSPRRVGLSLGRRCRR